MTTPSTRPVPSNLPQDLLFNAEKLDQVVNSVAPTYRDRFNFDRLTAQGAIDTIRAYNPRGAWASATLYAAKDLVKVGELWYLCLDAHTSSLLFATDMAAHWRLFQGLEQANTVLTGDGVTDMSAALTAANAIGLPLDIKGVLYIASPVTITAPIVKKRKQLFSALSTVTINNGMAVLPEWFGPVDGAPGGVLRRAVNAQAKGVIEMAVEDYISGFDTATGDMFNNRGGTPGLDYMIKPNIHFQGAKLPSYASDNSKLENGTRVVGMMYVSSECSGFGIDRVGFDGGPVVVAARYSALGGCEGFCFLQTNKATPKYGSNIRIGSIIALCKGGDTVTDHAILLEAIDGGSVDYAEGRGALHGVVLKTQNFTAGSLVGSLNRGEDVILKSDSYAPCGNTDVKLISSTGKAEGDSGYGAFLQAASAPMGVINIATITSRRKATGLGFESAGPTLSDVQVGSFTSQNCPTGISYVGGPQRVQVGQAKINAFGSAGNPNASAVTVDAATTDSGNVIDNLSINIGTTGANSRGVDVSGRIRIGELSAKSVNWAMYHRTLAARIFVGGGVVTENVPFLYSGDVPTLAGSWGSINGTFRLDLTSGNLQLLGRITGGAADLITTLADPFRPSRQMVFPILGYTGSAFVQCQLTINTDGTVVLSNRAAVGTASGWFISLDGIKWAIPF